MMKPGSIKKRHTPAGMAGAGVLLSSFALSGCTTSLVVKPAASDDARVGLPYPLLYNAFDITITRRLVACASAADVYFKAEIKPLGSHPDPHHAYVIDPNSLASWMKTSEVKLNYYPSGAPKSLNVTVEDKTGAVMSNVLGTFAKIGNIAIGVPGGPPSTESVCTPAVMKALEDVTSLNAKLAEKEGKVGVLTAELKALVDKIAGVASEPDAATKQMLSRRYDELQVAKEQLTALTEQLADVNRVLTDVEPVVWPRDGDTWQGVIQIRPFVLQRWFRNPKDENVKPRQFDVAFDIKPLSMGNHARANNRPQNVSTVNGIPYRPPVAGVLRVCKSGPCPEEGSEGRALIGRVDADLLQLGTLYYLACTSRPFSSIGCAFELTEAGQLQSIGTSHQAAVAEGAMAAAKDVATQLAAMQAERDAAPLKQTQARVNELKAQADLIAAQKALTPDLTAEQTAAVNAQADLYKAELARLEAEEALRAAYQKAGKGQ
jgi:hypothetical protein